jgi:hypothetical protein
VGPSGALGLSGAPAAESHVAIEVLHVGWPETGGAAGADHDVQNLEMHV